MEDEKILKELKRANILKAIEISKSANEDDRKIVNYILHSELSELQLDKTLFPKEEPTKSWNYHM